MSESINQVGLALELLVTFAGVFLAFMLDRLIDWRKDQKTKQELLRNLALELNRVKESLVSEASRLNHDIYDSAVASGKLILLTSEQLMKITNVYIKIRNTDNRALSVIIAKDALEQNKDDHSQERYSFLNNVYNARKQETSKLIAEVLGEPWLRSYVQER